MLESLEKLNCNVVSIQRAICQRGSRQKQLRLQQKDMICHFYVTIMLHAWKVSNVVPSFTGMSKEKIDLPSYTSLNCSSILEDVIEYLEMRDQLFRETTVVRICLAGVVLTSFFASILRTQDKLEDNVGITKYVYYNYMKTVLEQKETDKEVKRRGKKSDLKIKSSQQS